ncbi:uncharacterized protein PRCAT00003406001 [Priceomyces carsonii]|uniref:uncharacterized protein n=1 Tax=Priceomyces carsonii TaxID=28549 RepID=UPI002ED80A5B|nr:unnamed protein product [Priceomyces carsonii]
MSVAPITCHILDTTRGKPARDVNCQLFFLSPLISNPSEEGAYELNADVKPFAMNRTDKDGRIKNWVLSPNLDAVTKTKLGIEGDYKWDTLSPGIYKIKFLTGKYFYDTQQTANRTFFPFVEIVFQIDNPPDLHYHIPLLLSNHSYTTYRGS